MARPPALRLRTTRGLVPCVAALVAVLTVGSIERAAGSGQALEPVRSDTAWYGGAPPRIARVDVTGERLDAKTRRYHFRANAIVNRVEADRNGTFVILRARTWEDAFQKIDAVAVAQLGIAPGFTRDSIVKTFGYSQAELRRPFPDLTASVAYEVFVGLQDGLPRLSNGLARRPMGPRAFIEPLSIGIPPGTHEVGVLGCFWPDESHEMLRTFSWLIRAALGGVSLNSVRKAVITAAAGTPGTALVALVADELAEELGKAFAINTVTCATSASRLTLRTKVPGLAGLDPDAARNALRARWLRGEFDTDIVRRASCDGFHPVVLSQGPPPGTPAARDAKVFVSTRHCVETGPPPASPACDPKNPWHGTWSRVEHAGTMRVTQTGGQIKRFAWSWFGRSGQFDQLRLSGRTLTGRDPGQSTFSITITPDAKEFHGTYKWIGRTGGGKFNGKRADCSP